MLAINMQYQVNVPSVANTRERDFYHFVRRADVEELKAQRNEIAACLDTKAVKAMESMHSEIVDRMKDRLRILDESISISLN